MPRCGRATVQWGPRRRRPGSKPSCGPVRAADRLSALPDALLHHVMSFLKAWEAVRTCVLARRWRDLWASAPCLDLRVTCSRRDGDPPEEFGKFVCRLLLARDPSAPVDTLRLRSSDGDDYMGTYDNGDVNMWIRFAIKHSARVIHLNGHRKDDLALEHTAFVSCHLKVLKFSYVKLDAKVLKQLSSQCPSLEDLHLSSCSVEGHEITSHSLKNLTMVKCWITVDFSVAAPNLLFLLCITPYYRVPLFKNLGSLVSASITVDDSFLCDDEYLHIDEEFEETSDEEADGDYTFVHSEEKSTDNKSDDDSFGYDDLLDESEVEHNDGLVDNHQYGADIDSDKNTYEYSEIADECRPGQYSHLHDTPKQGGSYVDDSTNRDKSFGGQNVLRSLSNVTRLELLAHSGEVVLLRELKRCSTFSKLTMLSLGEWCMAADFDALLVVLQQSPKLERLFLKLELDYGNKKAVKFGVEPKERSFVCRHLAMVKIICSKDDARVHKLAGFFRANGIPLEKIFIRRSGSTYLRSMRELREICRDELREARDWWR